MPSSLVAPIVGAVAGKALSSIGGGGGKSTGSQTTVTQPQIPEWLAQNWQDLIGQAKTQSQTPFASYGGEGVAPLSGDEQTAFQSLRDLMGSSNSAYGGAQNTLQQIMQRAIGGPSSEDIQGLMNPYTSNVLDTQNLRSLQDYDRQMGAFKSKAATSGAFGGSGDYIQRAMASKNLGEQLATNNAQGLSNAYNQAIGQYNTNTGVMGQTALNQANMAGNLQALNTTGANSLAQAGGTARGVQQAGDQFGYNEFLRQQNFPEQQTSFLADIMRQGSAPFTGQTATTSGMGPTPNSLNSIVGGAMAGSQLLGNSMGGSGFFNNVGNGINSFFGGSGFGTGYDISKSISANPSFFKKGGLVGAKKRSPFKDYTRKFAEGGLVDCYAGGGLTRILDEGLNPLGTSMGGGIASLLSAYMKFKSPSLADADYHELLKSPSDSGVDPLDEHADAVANQQLNTGVSQAQRPDLGGNGLWQDPMLQDNPDQSVPANAALSLPIKGSKYPMSLPENLLEPSANVDSLPQPVGSKDTPTLLNELINREIQKKMDEDQKPKSWIEQANTPLLAMGLSMMGSDNSSFGGALQEGYKAFQGASKNADEQKDKKLNDLLTIAEFQRKQNSQAIEDQLRKAQTEEALAKAHGLSNPAGKPLGQGDRTRMLTSIQNKLLGAIEKDPNLAYDPVKKAAAIKEAEKRSLEIFNRNLQVLGQPNSAPSQNSTSDEPIRVNSRAEAMALEPGTKFIDPNGIPRTR